MTGLRESLARARTLLYVPGHRPDRFAKAAASGADHIVLDLEDSVGPDVKADARAHVEQWLSAGGAGIVRVNSMDTPWHKDDVAMLAGSQCAVIMPKAARAEQVVDLLDRLADGSSIIPILETSPGILGAYDVCSAPGIVRAIFGSADLARELGIDHNDRPAMSYARSQVVLASAASGVAAPLDGATTAIKDDEKVSADAKDAAALGFSGKSCIHPRQIPLVRAAFTPSDEELEWARQILAAADNGESAALDGHFIGKPVVDRARRLLAKS